MCLEGHAPHLSIAHGLRLQSRTLPVDYQHPAFSSGLLPKQRIARYRLLLSPFSPSRLRCERPRHASKSLGNIIPLLIDRIGTPAYTSRQLVPDRGET